MALCFLIVSQPLFRVLGFLALILQDFRLIKRQFRVNLYILIQRALSLSISRFFDIEGRIIKDDSFEQYRQLSIYRLFNLFLLNLLLSHFIDHFFFEIDVIFLQSSFKVFYFHEIDIDLVRTILFFDGEIGGCVFAEFVLLFSEVHELIELVGTQVLFFVLSYCFLQVLLQLEVVLLEFLTQVQLFIYLQQGSVLHLAFALILLLLDLFSPSEQSESPHLLFSLIPNWQLTILFTIFLLLFLLKSVGFFKPFQALLDVRIQLLLLMNQDRMQLVLMMIAIREVIFLIGQKVPIVFHRVEGIALLLQG